MATDGVEVHRLGFTQLRGSSGASTFRANIVFVHGLKGSPRETWEYTAIFRRKPTAAEPLQPESSSSTSEAPSTTSSTSSTVFWPNDFLANDLPEARIWTYGYNADAIGGLFQARNSNSISQHGRDLSDQIEQVVLTNNQDPVLFVAHSLGGIIVKDAINQSQACQERCRLVVFLGTPQRSSNASSWGIIATNLAKVALQNPNQRVLEALKVDSEVLDNIQRSFNKILYQSTGRIKVHSFQEARLITGIKGLHGKVVSDFSSKLGLSQKLETVKSIAADHRQMARCPSRSCPQYRAILNVLKMFVQAVPPGKDGLTPQVSGLQSNQVVEVASPVLVVSTDTGVPALKPVRDDITGIGAPLKDLETETEKTAEHLPPGKSGTLEPGDAEPTPLTFPESKPRQKTWRILGVPADFNEARLKDLLKQHPDLRPLRDDSADDGHDGNSIDNGVQVHTLAPDLWHDQVATARFQCLPRRLRTLTRDQLTIDLSPNDVKGKRGPKTKLSIDQHFHGITVLSSPSTGNHAVDVLAVPGLGGHPYGSFVDKGDEHMWLSESLPRDMPTARVMLYGYDSGLQDSTSFAALDDLAGSLHISILQLLGSRDQRRLILIGHSLGGLLIKEALVQLSKSNSELDQMRQIAGVLFFGVPNDGMDIASLIPMVNDQPNRSLLESLSAINSQVLRIQEGSFAKLLTQRALNIFCFYETRESPTAVLDSAGKYKMTGPNRCLVTRKSAVSCLPYDKRSDHSAELPRTHSELVKFAFHDREYDKVSAVLRRMEQDSLIGLKIAGVSPSKHHYAVPLETAHTYTERVKLSVEIEQKMKIRHEKGSVPYAVALYGLGGTGKSQLALAYAENHKDQYNPILWIDATDKEAVRSSFRRCAAELGLPEERAEKQESVFEDGVVQAVLRWLRDRTEADDKWLVIVDNADDFTWGILKIMPKGRRGSVIVTSQDNQSVMLVPGACEPVHVGEMLPAEGVELLLQHLKLGAESASEEIRLDCDKIAQRLGYLALAIDLAGAYIGSGSAPEHALSQYLKDYERHRNELLKRDSFKGLLPTQKTVWTVWDTTLKKIGEEHSSLPELLLGFLAQFKGSIVQDEVFRLACLGMEAVEAELDGEADEVMPASLLQLLPLCEGKWEDFQYRESYNILVRYSLLQRVGEQWPGVTMHSLVQWRAMQIEPGRPWHWWYMKFIVAACCRMTGGKEHPEFRRELVVHLPDISGNDSQDGDWRRHADFIESMLGRVYYDEGRWEEAEKLFVQVMETRKTKLGVNHPDTLTSMNNLASTYMNQGRWEEAEKLQVQVMETYKTKLGVDHPDTLTSMGNLASAFRNQGRWEEAEKLEVHVMETRKTKLGVDHPYTLMSMSNLALTYMNQGQWEEAEKLQVQVIETSKTKLGVDHPDTLTSMGNLAEIYRNQGRWEEAEKLQVQVMETSTTKLGVDHPDTLTSMTNLALTYMNQGRWSEAEKLFVQVMENRKTKLGVDHPDTLTSMGNLAEIYRNQGRWEEAEKLQVQVMETSTTKLGVNHPSTLTSMTNLAATFWNQGRWSEAEKLFVQVMETRKTKLGVDHPDTLTSMGNLAEIYRNQGRWEEAEKLQVQVMETSTTKLGVNHPSTLISIGNLALTYMNQGRWEEAEKLQVQVMETRKTKLGVDHPDTVTSMGNLALTFRNQGRWSEAEKLFVQVMETRKTKLGVDHPDTLVSMGNLAETYRNQGRWEKAEKLFVQVMETRKTKLRVDHPYTLMSMGNLALTYMNQGRWEEAEKLEVQVMETRKTKLGVDHPDTLTSMGNLAFTWEGQGRRADAVALMRDCAEAQRRVLGEEHPSTLSSLATVAKWSS